MSAVQGLNVVFKMTKHSKESVIITILKCVNVYRVTHSHKYYQIHAINYVKKTLIYSG